MRATEAELGIHAKTARQFLASVQNFSDRLKHALETSNKRKGALAEHCGVEASTVTRWLKGTQPMSEHILTMATFLGVDAKWLMVGDSLPCNAGSLISPKNHGVGESAQDSYAMREEPALYRVRKDAGETPALPLEERVARLEAALESITKVLRNL